MSRAYALSTLLPVALLAALGGCWVPNQSAVAPPSDPPSGEIRPEAPIPYETLVEHYHFNTKSRVKLAGLSGHVIEVHGPVCRVEGQVLHFESENGSYLKAICCTPVDLRQVQKGQRVNVLGTFVWNTDCLLLADAKIKK